MEDIVAIVVEKYELPDKIPSSYNVWLDMHVS